ncbi:MAG TPA: SAM-dependent chlorinase/fluorinase, partial [Burkholderiales bacterium]|nr:SAM-dependent chlorinase/fluorinase [Burkholderiales bacterium]
MDRVSAIEALRILRQGRPRAALGVRRRPGGAVRLKPGGGPGIAIPIVLFTDFGASDLYVGQVKAFLATRAPRVPVLDALHDAPDYGIEPGAHLLAALAPQYPRG